MAEFDQYAKDYSLMMNRSIGWTGQDHDAFVAAKARLLVSLLRRHAGDPGSATVLDVGCGVGLIDRLLAGSVKRLSGVDVSADSVSAAAQACPGGDFLAYDGARLPFADQSFDLAFTSCVIHHVPPGDWKAFAAEMARVLKPGGLAVVIEHNPYNPVTRHMVNNCPFDEDAVLITMRGTRVLLEGAGLKTVTRKYTTFIPVATPLNGPIENLLGWLPLGAQYVVAAQKQASR